MLLLPLPCPSLQGMGTISRGVILDFGCFDLEKYETAKGSLRQGDEEVNKAIKQKYIYLNKLPNISVCKQTFVRG